jgi:Zn-dependent metalloprotease
MRFHRDFTVPSVLLLALSACSGADVSSSTPSAEKTQLSPKIDVEVTGPVRIVAGAGRLRAQKMLDALPSLKTLRIDDFGDVRNLVTSGDILTSSTPMDMAIEAIALYSEALGFEGIDKAGIAAHVTLDRVLTDDSVMHIRLRQTHEGVTMDDRSIDVHVTLASPSRLIAINGSGALPVSIDVSTPIVPEADALKVASRQISPDLTPTFASSLRYIDVDGKSTLAWRIDLKANGVADTHYVSASSGELLRTDQAILHGNAQAYVPSSGLGGRSWQPLANLYVSPEFGSQRVTTDRNGNFDLNGNVRFSIEGPYFSVKNESAPSYSYAGDDNARVEFEAGNTHESELAVFVNGNKVHDWLADNFNYRGLDRQIPTFTHSNDCNAWADPEKYDLHFGECGTPGTSTYWDLALSTDIAMHEYMHLVADDIIKLKGSCYSEAGALGEGMSDYFACTVTGDSRIGEDSSGRMSRNCQNNMRYATDYRSGECHDGAFVYSGSMWDLRTQRGAGVADELAFRSMYYMPERPTFIDVRDAVLAADRARMGGAHENDILRAFSNHGINDDLVLFLTTDNPNPLIRPFQALVVAHAQGFDRKTVNYAWSFDDGSTDQGDEIVHTFRSKSGWAKVTVSDRNGTTKSGELNFSSACSQSASPAWLVLVGLAFLVARRKH